MISPWLDSCIKVLHDYVLVLQAIHLIPAHVDGCLVTPGCQKFLTLSIAQCSTINHGLVN